MQLKKEYFEKALDRLKSLKIVVIGDIMLDEYLIGSVYRISPEAPVPVVLIKEENLTLGGSGNVIKNLNAIAVKSSVFGKAGKDSKLALLKTLLMTENMEEEDVHILECDGIPTTVKTRIIATHQQVCRVDREKIMPITETEEASILNTLKEKILQSDALIISDYDKGYLTKTFISSIIKMAKDHQKFIAIDPQVSHFFYYNNASILTPNHHEAGSALGKKLHTDEEVENACKEITNRLSTDSMMITRGEKGITIYIKNIEKIYHIPTIAREVFDVTGAGDTVISIYTAFRVAGLSEYEAAIVANAGAGVVVQKLGSSTVTVEELYNALLEMDLLS
ncbi:MAG: D-glycero-beta-D-manno-heptose-7-phosphate kinase [Leptospiraceae bacterium]|nr:D-glycero-beta-D-manno-heptose-7-phosphate kinase [Leptospiraceae bacterium]MCP5495569.1 D-glycero-beta-D-manno-heptose-7-phosphate kinase [Leptospiraceae bacterium]